MISLSHSFFSMNRFKKRWIAWTFLAAWIAIGAWNTTKPLPEGTNVSSQPAVSSGSTVKFFTDRTFKDIQGREHNEQQIFDAVFDIIDHAETFVVADFFLFNEMMGAASSVHRRLGSELAQHLVARKLVKSNLTVIVITDPINEVYGGPHSSLLEELRRAGVEVVTTDLSTLRDSNPAYSALWRMFIQWWGNAPDRGSMPNPFGGPSRITVRSWLALLNFKANHRKVVVADREDSNTVALVTSANPHDASSAHSNVGMQVEGDVARSILASELAVARFSGWRGQIQLPMPAATLEAATDPVRAAYLTEAAIREHLLGAFGATRSGDSIRIAVFYLADRQIVTSLLAAANRGVTVNLILDPNKDAFGRQKDGVPNRPVANELVSEGGGRIDVRWYRTHGEQFHTKLALVTRGDTLTASLGSANYTRRNIGNYNLEANLALDMTKTSPLAMQMLGYFDELWGNSAQSQEPQFTAPFGAYQDTDRGRYWRYRLMEATGWSTF